MACKTSRAKSATATKLVTREASDSEETTTAQNLRLLKAIIDHTVRPSAPKIQAKRPKIAQSTNTPQPAKAATKRNAVKKVEIHEDVSAVKFPASRDEQRKLATNCFNSSLKVLSALVKKQQVYRAQKENVTNGASSKTNRTPLQAQSPNKIAISQTTVTSSEQEPDALLHAECASAALDVLRQEDEGPQTETAVRKREQGAILLLERLTSLDLKAISRIEASKIHEQYWKRRKSSKPRTVSSKRSEHVSLAAMLIQEVKELAREDFNLVCSLQSQTIRLAILDGSTSITPELVKAVALNTSGSPANVILHGHKEGFLEADKAGESLQTVAQALSKLSTSAMKTKQSVSTVNSLILLTEAQLIKVASWELLKQKPDLQHDLWSVFERGIRKLWDNKEHKDLTMYEITITCVKDLHTKLENSSYCSDAPLKLQEFLVQLAEANADHETARTILTALSSDVDEVERLFCICKLATLNLDAALANEDRTSSSLQNALSSLTATRPPTLILSIERLLTLARFRKACLSRIAASISKPDPTIENASIVLIKIMFAIFRFCSVQFDLSTEADERLRHSLHLALLKNVEAVTDIEKYAFNAHGVFEDYMIVIGQCLEALNELENGFVRDDPDRKAGPAIRALRLRLSNVYWRAHLHPRLEQDSQNQVINLAQWSINALDGMPIEELSHAAIGPRLEKLAGMQGLAGKHSDAQNSLERAIRHYVASRALSDAVEAALSKRSAEVWTDQASIAFQLGRVLRAYGKLTREVAVKKSTATYVFNDGGLPEFHQAVMLECQILYATKQVSCSPTITESIGCAKHVLGLASARQYRAWRLRFLSSLISHLVKNHILDAQQKLSINQLIEDVLSEVSDEDGLFLKQYNTALQSLLRLQQLLLTGKTKFLDLQDQLRTLQRAVCSCSTETDLAELIDDTDCVYNALQACTTVAMALGNDEVRCLCLTIRLHLSRCKVDRNLEEISNCHIQLAQCQLRTGNISDAKKSLASIDLNAVPNEVHLEVFLASAEFQLVISDLDQCEIFLAKARSIFQGLWPQNASLNSGKQIERDSIIARGAFVASQLAFRQGKLQLAAQYARQAAKISISIWAALAKRVSEASSIKHDSTIGTLTEDLSQMNLDSKSVVDVSHTEGARYWPYLDMHARSLRHIAEVMAHSGMYDDAVCFWERLKTFVSSVQQAEGTLSPAGSLALMLAKAGKVRDAVELLSTSHHLTLNTANRDSIAESLSHVEALVTTGQVEVAKRLIQQIPPQPLLCVDKMSATLNDDNKAIKPASKARRGLGKPKAITGPAKRRVNSKMETIRQPAVKAANSDTTVMSSLVSFDCLRVEDHRRALVTLLSSDEAMTNRTGNIEELPCNVYLGAQFLVHELFAKAKALFAEAWQDLSAESMASLLTESATAFPSKASTPARKGRVSFLQGSASESRVSSKDILEQSNAMASIQRKLCSAGQIVDILQKERQQYCPTDMVHALVVMEARIDLLLTTMNYPFTTASIQIVLQASQSKDVALQRERLVLHAELATQDRSSLSKWPEPTSGATNPTPMIDSKRLHDLPASWNIVSLSLSEDGDELLLSKLVSGRSPFLVRIPLHRSNEGEGSEVFVYDDARKEMKDIIDHANSSSHDVRGTADRATRAQWHADREVLDRQLGTLLENIENMWLGGFRGVITPQAFDQELVKQFRLGLEQSLDNHLPSRQKSIALEKKVQVHEHILEIFLGLGTPDENDLDDAIMDLLYFVVDILQFDGEQNAYDEVDWDAMLVNIIDALRAFHEAQSSIPQQQLHTILILDKELELFPWEALPCLIEHPVSRMPSLGSVFDRLDLIRQQSRTAEVYTVQCPHPSNQVRGAYILNPSLDLTSTQSLLEPILVSHRPAFKPIINHAPTEQEFIDYLTNNDVLLYFGHGSGAQYIRGRTIRALDKCAVTWLMGCSSAKMTTCGKGESHGMPRYYMLGHSMAVVGCLWDVTDREIDRVSLKSMAVWGLVDGQDQRVIDGLKRKGRKAREANMEEKSEKKKGSKKTLVQAVTDGRRASVLRYLCGAAVVVYGVPVVLG